MTQEEKQKFIDKKDDEWSLEIQQDFKKLATIVKKPLPIHDQKRIMQPKEAIKLGANYLVIGRPILNAKDPMKIINLINEEKI